MADTPSPTPPVNNDILFSSIKTVVGGMSPEEMKEFTSQYYTTFPGPYIPGSYTSPLYTVENPTLDERIYKKMCDFMREALAKGVGRDRVRKMRDEMVNGLLERMLYGCETYDQFMQLYTV